MANLFRGYLIKATKTGVILPLHYIQWEGYTCTPNQREEIKAYRDENTRDLYRVTAQGMKTKLEFDTIENLRLDDKIAFLKFFTDGESDAHQRKINLEYWNDEENKYKTSDFYRPDISFDIKKITEDDIIYKSLHIALVEY